MRLFVVGLPLSFLLALTSSPAFAALEAKVEALPDHPPAPFIEPQLDPFIITSYSRSLPLLPYATRLVRAEGGYPASPGQGFLTHRNTAYSVGAKHYDPNTSIRGPPQGI